MNYDTMGRLRGDFANVSKREITLGRLLHITQTDSYEIILINSSRTPATIKSCLILFSSFNLPNAASLAKIPYFSVSESTQRFHAHDS